jgi:putative ABC transport system ATP-binding protein
LAGYLVENNKKAVRERAHQLMEQLGITHLADKLPGQISGGEAQRCTVARALINNPMILMADEPTGNLNSEASQRVLRCFSELRQTGQSIVMVTHDILSAAFADEVFYIKDGVILGHLTIENLGSTRNKEQALKQWLENVDW